MNQVIILKLVVEMRINVAPYTQCVQKSLACIPSLSVCTYTSLYHSVMIGEITEPIRNQFQSEQTDINGTLVGEFAHNSSLTLHVIVHMPLSTDFQVLFKV